MIREALAPYALYIRLGLAAVLLGAAFIGGCQMQKGREAEARADLNREIADLRLSLTLASDALDVVNAEAERRVKEHEAMLAAAAAAIEAAAQARAHMDRRIADYQKELDAARRRSPKCAELLAMDLEAVCGL